MAANKILLADSEFGPQSVLAYMLESRNFQVMRARSIDEAWRILTTEHPRMMLLDPMMPSGTDGFHLVWRLRDYPDGRVNGLPVIMMSRIHKTTGLKLFPKLNDGHYEPNEFLPIQAFLDKPFDERFLMETIDDVLRQT